MRGLTPQAASNSRDTNPSLEEIPSIGEIDASRQDNTVWAIVLRRSEALLYEYHQRRPFKLIESYQNPEGRAQTKELVSDRAGETSSVAVGGGRPTAVPSEDAHEHSLTTFTRMLADVVDKALARGTCQSIVLIAEPHCLGRMNQALSKEAAKRVVATVNKDLLPAGEDRIREELELALSNHDSSR